ncbi:MAG TPA: hypothetical protein VM553_00390, partial [Dongiaceae bacterium]|nr:hypothetical protein [Dongiaceae bacterium]
MTTKHLLALFLTIALAACGGGGNNDDGKDSSPRDSDPIGDPVTPNDPTTPAYIGGGGSQIRLGLVTGATVSFYIYGDLSQSILTTTSTTLAELEMSLGPAAFGSLSDEEKLQQAGKIDLHGFEFEPDTWYLAVTEGGEDIDVDGNRQIDAAGTPIKGQIHGVLQGRHINNGQYNLSLLTELAYQSIEARLAKTGSAVQQAYAALPTTDLQEPANQAAAQLVHDLVDGQATYIDLISWRPGSENLQPAMQQTLQTNITGQLRAGDDMSAIIQQALRETTTIRYNPYWYSQAQGIPSHLDGTWILIGHMVYTSQTEAGPITQHYLTRHTLRVSKDQDRMDIYRFQMCGNLHDWTDIVSLPVLDTLRFRFGLYEFWRQADGTYDVTFAFDSPDNTIKGNFIAIRRSASPEASFG